MRNVTAREQYNLSGEKVCTNYYDSYGRKMGSSVERHNPWTGKYSHTDLYDSHNRKVGMAK